MLVPTVHHGKDTTHKSLETMCNARAWPQQCWKSCANGSNIVALRFGDHGTKEMLGVVGSEVWSVSNFAQQLPTTRNNMQQGVRRTQTCNTQQCWKLLNNNVTSVCTGLCTLDFFYNKKKMRTKVTVLVGLWCACSAVLRAKRVCVKTNMPEIVVFTVPSTCFYTVVPRYHEPLVKSRFHCITP